MDIKLILILVAIQGAFQGVGGEVCKQIKTVGDS